VIFRFFKILHFMLQASEILKPASNIKSTITLCFMYLIDSRTVCDSSCLCNEIVLQA
jgi:hypothetical protein